MARGSSTRRARRPPRPEPGASDVRCGQRWAAQKRVWVGSLSRAPPAVRDLKPLRSVRQRGPPPLARISSDAGPGAPRALGIVKLARCALAVRRRMTASRRHADDRVARRPRDLPERFASGLAGSAAKSSPSKSISTSPASMCSAWGESDTRFSLSWAIDNARS